MRHPSFWTSPWFLPASIGYLVRLIVMPLMGQHDVMFMPWMSHYINLGHFNLYAYLYDTFGDLVMHKPAVWAPYPYGFYAYTSLWLKLLETLGLVNLADWNSIWAVEFPARLVFLFKAAYLPFDLVIAYVLYRVAGGMGVALWAWAPSAIYSPFMMGQNDIYATAFAVVGTYAAAKSLNKSLASAARGDAQPGRGLDRWGVLCGILLGLGAIFKVYPLLLLPPLALLITSAWRRRITLVAVGCLIFAAAALPFLTTQPFVQGVLFNVEGVRAVGSSAQAGLQFSPFLLAYLLLLCALAASGSRPKPGELAWGVGFLLLASLFLLAQAPFYWLIWLTPFAVALTTQHSRSFWAWLAVQCAFVLALFAQHRELGVALPIHLESTFNMPNLPELISLLGFNLSQTFSEALLLLSRLSLGLSLLPVLTAARRPVRPTAAAPVLLTVIVAPLLMMAFGLSANLLLSRNLVTEDKRADWQQREVRAGEVVVQQLGPKDKAHQVVTGFRLQVGGATPGAMVTVCLYHSQDVSREPLACARRRIDHPIDYRLESQRLYFVFDAPVALLAADTPSVTIRVEGEEAAVTLLYAPDSAGPLLQFAGTPAGGLLDLVALLPFNAPRAFDRLIGENVGGDPVLLTTMVIVWLAIQLFLILLFRKHPDQALEQRELVGSGV